jgi:phosphoribosylanthranilate isomerase
LGKPLLKFCGLREVEDAQLCEELGVDMIGINFVPRSMRKVDIEQGKAIAGAVKTTIPVGVFENQSASEVNDIARKTGIKAIQLSGDEQDLDGFELPIIKTIKLGADRPAKAFLTIIDGNLPGSGRTVDHAQLSEKEPSLIAGGINQENVQSLLELKQPLGIDTASGIETGGKVDQEKIRKIHSIVSQANYSR